jgi:hypothetical protein
LQTVAILNAVLDEVTEAKHRLAELIGRYINLDSVSDPKTIPAPGDTRASPQNSHAKTIDTLIAS